MGLLTTHAEIEELAGGRARQTIGLKPIAYRLNGNLTRILNKIGNTGDPNLPLGVDELVQFRVRDRLAGNSPVVHFGKGQSHIALETDHGEHSPMPASWTSRRIIWRRGKGLLNRPSTTKAVVNKPWPPSSDCSPFDYGMRFAIERYNAATSSVAGLCYSICPTTIAQGIVSFIVNPFKLESGRAWPHITIKGFKGVKPFIANLNAPTPVILVGLMRWGYTTCFHMYPCSKFFAVGHSVCTSTVADQFACKTAATPCVSRRQPVTFSDDLVPALTTATPIMSLFAEYARMLQYRKSPIYTTSSVNPSLMHCLYTSRFCQSILAYMYLVVSSGKRSGTYAA